MPGNTCSFWSIAAIRSALLRYLPSHCAYGFRPTKNSSLKKPVESVPSSGRPSSEPTVVTSGKERRIRRICGEIFEASLNEMVYGMVARTHSEPSSRCGMNSAPMPRIITSATSSNASETPVTRHAYCCRRSSPRTYHALNLS
ncbi:hypothetical protein RLIN73S_00584 [Rhodanobacter lindaniclasticus]